MKRIKLLLAALAAMVGLGAYAQSWTGSAPAVGTFFLYNVGAGKFINVGDKSAGWGTNAYLTAEYGLDFNFEAKDNGFSLNSQISNGGSNNYLTTALWCDGAATAWTFTKVDRTDINAYTISNGSSYIVANAAGTDIEYVGLSGTERDQWQLIGSSDILANLQANTAAGVKRTVATFFISDPDFGRNDLRMTPGNFQWTFSSDGGETVIPGRDTGYLGKGGTDVNGNYPNYGCQFWNNTFDIHQELTNLPNGIYEFEIYGFGTNGTTYVYATTAEGTTSKVFKNQTSASNFRTALNNIDNYGGNVTGLVQVTDGTLTIGVKRENNSAADWTVIDQARLYYYGDYTFADAYGADLKALIAEAQALVDATPMAALATDLEAAITTAQGVMTTGESESEFVIGKTNLQNAVDAYNAKLTLVSRYMSVRAAALSIIPDLNVTTTDADALAATTTDAVDAAIATLRANFLTALASVEIPNDPGYIDVTAVMVDNASVRQNTNYWTIYNYEGYPNTSYSNGVTNYEETEFYQQQFKFYQTLALIPGTWEFGVTGFHRAGNHSTYFYAGDDKILIPGVADNVVNSMAQAKNYFDEGNGKVALKFLIETAGDVEIGINNQDTQTDRWTIFRDFTLRYYGAPDYSVYETQWSEAVAAADAALATYAEFDGFVATEKTALTTAKGNVPTPEGLKAGYLAKIQALTDATAAYIAASQKYQSAKEAIEKANAIKEAHNFASAEAIATFADAIKVISDKYDDLSLTQEEATAAAANLGVAVTEWHAGNNTPAAVYMRDGFALGDFDAALYVNTWSTEGDTDGSGFSVPFYEYWTADANSLGEKTWTGTLTDLPNGLYSVTAWVRVRAKNEVAAADATGITMDVNGGGEGDYAAVDVTEGTQVGETQFQLKEYTAQNLVKDGKLTLNFNVAADNNISWLSFKNVKYTKVRDLTPEEAFVPATAEDYAALNEAIAAHVIGFEAGEYAPYNNIEALAAVAAAQAIDQTAQNAQEDVQAATAAITGATWTVNVAEVNAIYNGDFAIAAHDGATPNPQPTGWYRNEGTYTGDGYNVRYVNIPEGVAGNTSNRGLFGKFTMKYGAESGYSLPLKQGYYKLTFSYGGWNEIGTREVKLYNDDNDATVEVSTVTAANNTGHTTASSWRAYSSLITVPAAGDYTLSFYRQNTSNQNQLVLTDIVLVKATAEDLKPLLNAEIETANAIYNNGANVGTGVFQIPAAAGDAFNTAINTTAQGVYDNVSATADEVITAISDLKAAEETYAAAELNAPDAEQLYNIVVATAGHAKENNPIIIIPGTVSANNPTGYALNANFETNKNLSQAFTFTQVEGNSYKISAKVAGVDVYLTNGTLNGSAAGWKASQIQATTDADNAMIFTIEAADTEGAFNIVNAETNSTIACQNGGNIYTEAGNADFKLVETTKPSITINTTAAGYGTVMVPFAVASLPEGVIAYTCAEVGGKHGNTLKLESVSALEANKPYIIEGNWDETLTGDAQGTALTYGNGLLTGVYAATPAPVGSYVLQKNDDVVGFYKVAENEQPTVGANRAYLTVPAGVKADAFFFDDDTATAIQSVFSGVAAGEIYDLSGRKLNKLQKGVNIVNGKKVMVK